MDAEDANWPVSQNLRTICGMGNVGLVPDWTPILFLCWNHYLSSSECLSSLFSKYCVIGYTRTSLKSVGIAAANVLTSDSVIRF